MSDYAYAALDLDGTLLDTDGTVSGPTLAGLRRLRDGGLALFVVSGRSPYAVRLLGLTRAVLDLLEPVMVLSEGDILWNWRTDSIEELRTVPDTVIPTLVTAGLNDFVVDTGSGLFASSRSAAIRHAIFYRIPRSSITVSDHPPATPAAKVTAYAEPAAVMAALRGIKVSFHPAPEGRRCNVVPSGACKTAGLARLLARHYQEPTLSRVIAFGDGDNDACLLRTAGAGVAMAVSAADTAGGATLRLTGSLATYLNDEFPQGLDDPRTGLRCSHQP